MPIAALHYTSIVTVGGLTLFYVGTHPASVVGRFGADGALVESGTVATMALGTDWTHILPLE